jgi:ArsR family transcriptional regulator, arsenate/arsenite/antimonite-responsive transcriptional repressor
MNDILRIFKALSDSTRLRIILLLRQKDLCVCELTFVLKMSQSRISHQLRILRDAGLAEDKRDGKWIIYGVPPHIRNSLRALLSSSGKNSLKKSAEAIQDLKNLKICFREDIRKSRCPRGRAVKNDSSRRKPRRPGVVFSD